MGTDVKFQGFMLNIAGTAIDRNEYLAHLGTKNGDTILLRPFERILCVDSSFNPDFVLGLFITIKDLKRFTEYRDHDGQFALNARELDGGRIAEFNFFVLNKKTWRGIYQYYYNSCSLQRFLAFLKSQFSELRRFYIDEARSIPSRGERNRKIVSLKHTALRTEILVRPETFAELLRDFSHIKEMKLNVTTFDADSAKYRPLTEYTTKRVEIFSFQKEPKIMNALRQAITEFAGRPEIDELSVKGRSDENNIDYTIGLFKNVADFGHHSYNDLTEHFSVNPDTFVQSRIIELLVETAEKHSYIIG